MNEIDNKIIRAVGGMWFRNAYGVIVNGTGWEIVKDAAHPEDCAYCAAGEPMLHQYEGDGDELDPAKPWSLWHHGEYVGNYATVEAAKGDVDTSDCGKCRDLS